MQLWLRVQFLVSLSFFGLDTDTVISESGALHGKPAYKKENGTNNHTSPSSSVAFGMAGNNFNWQPPAQWLVLLESQILGSFVSL